ncbi:PilZ domain-containing protein [Novosphingobium album (ex Liu et al. 2023)]|uniref:PilZ domain-containing protein n=1 Tax=Novosphingobium album (ex Liu et al. 2023) TaxID=3031130 RepID=A0ABT5WQF6_9SPHN|nr:PilZ domain-containing protein [Novosphingobium album (ex Liu et al. 2023)]MDE8652269.1 PilZ domain-containing protein [Novosphingobium album (ex Liu et al. 2023)]
MSESGPNQGEGQIDHRGAGRTVLLLRSAKLLTPAGQFLCLLRDVSAAGVRLRFLHAMPEFDNRVTLQTASQDQYALELVWQSQVEAGYRFSRPIDLEAFITERTPFEHRPIRVVVSSAVVLTIGETRIPARLRDVSREGARLDIESKLALGQRLKIVGRDWPETDATVCWRLHPEHGVSFQRSVELAELAQRIMAMNMRNA